MEYSRIMKGLIIRETIIKYIRQYILKYLMFIF